MKQTILILALSVLVLASCAGCGNKKAAETADSEIVVEQKNELRLSQRMGLPFQITDFQPHSDDIPVDSILFVAETCLVGINNEEKYFEDEDSEEANAYFTAIDDVMYYTAEVIVRFEKMGVKSIFTWKRYLSFALAGGEKIIVDTEKTQLGVDMLLYRKGCVPLFISTVARGDWTKDMEIIEGYLQME